MLSIAAANLCAQNLTQEMSVQDAFFIENEAKQSAAVWSEDSYRRAQSLYEESARKWLSERNYQKYAGCLRDAAQLKISLNESEDARQLLSDSLRAERKAGNINGEAETLSYLTMIAARDNELKAAEQFLKKALAIVEHSAQPDAAAKVYFAAAEYHYRNQRNLPLMTEYLEKSARLFHEAGDKKGEAEALIELAYTFVMSNDRARGRSYAKEAVNIARSISDQRNLALALIALGDADQRVGNHQSSLNAFEEAESIYPENLDHYEKAILFVRFGFYYETFGDLVQARSYFQKARQLFIKTKNLYGNSELATRIGQISLQLNDEAEALRNFNEGLQIALESKDRYSLAYAYENFGDLYFSKQNYKNASENYRKALTNFDKVGIKHAVATVKEKLGKLHARLGDELTAEKVFTEALQINRDIRSKVGEASSLYNLARLHESQNQIDKSLREIEECLFLTDFLHGETANGKLKRGFLAEMYDRYELYINLLMKKHAETPNENYAVRALQAAEKSRARSMLENLRLAEADFSEGADIETIEREKEIRVLLNTKADELTNLLSSKADKNETEKLDAEINELENELEQIKAKLKQSSPLYSAIRNPAPFDVGELQNKILNEDSLLLEFFLGEKESYLWLVGKNEVSVHILPPRERIESLVESLRSLLASREKKNGETAEDYQKRIAEAENEYALEARNLSDELFGQIADKITNKRLIVVADGKLHYFPLSALPSPVSDSNEPILVTSEIVYEPSAQMLSLLAKNNNRTQPPKNLLVFSDPVFSEDDPRYRGESETIENPNSETASTGKLRFAESLNSLPRLAASKEESDLIINAVGSSKFDVFSGFEANRETLLNAEVSDYKIIHFATHGLIDEQRPELSGILLSRFDAGGHKINEFVRLQDIYGLNFSADLIVLSACDTGVGKQLKGEGLMSLNNAFLQSGAKSVVSSLWKVDDYATRELMRDFYAALAKGETTPAQALREAKLKLRRNPVYKSPFYWAAFTIQGDFNNVPSLSTEFNYKIYIFIALVPILAFGVYRFSRYGKSKS